MSTGLLSNTYSQRRGLLSPLSNSGPAIGLGFGLTLMVLASSAFALDEGEAQPKKGETDEQQRPSVGLTGIELEELESDYSPEVDRFFIPPYYQETAGNVKLRLVFPLFFYRERVGKGARSDLGIMPFYWRYREGPASADVFFPFYWRFRDPSFDTDIVLQSYYNRSSHGYNFGFAPLLFLGKDTRDQSDYQVIPPLFWRFAKGDSLFLLAGLFYNRKKGSDYDLGLPPILFAGRERYKTYLTVFPPLFWRFTDEINYKTTTVLPPLFYSTREHGYSFGLLPLLYIGRDKKWDRTLITPFYYGSRWQHRDQFGDPAGEGRSYYLPLLLSYYRHAPGLSQGGAALFYHWYENEGSYLRAITPLLWMWGNQRTDDRAVMVPPLFYRRTTPVTTNTMAGLIYWDFHEHHKERTVAVAPLFATNWSLYEDRWRTWVAPTFDFGVQPDGYHFRIHPLFYLGRDKYSDHLVLAPLLWKFRNEQDDDFVIFPIWWSFKDREHGDSVKVAFPFWWDFNDPGKQTAKHIAFPIYWDFANNRKKERTSVIFPLLWRDRDPRSTMSGFLNFVWHKGEIKGNPFWTFKIFPLIGLGHPPAPSGAYWSVLGGLAGWRRQGSTKELKVLWIPFDLSD